MKKNTAYKIGKKNSYFYFKPSKSESGTLNRNKNFKKRQKNHQGNLNQTFGEKKKKILSAVLKKTN